MRNGEAVIGALCDALVQEAADKLRTDGQHRDENPWIVMDQEPLPKARVLNYLAEPAHLFVVNAQLEMENRLTEETEFVQVQIVAAATEGDAIPILSRKVEDD